MEEWKRGYKPFMHIYAIPPIDDWENALTPSIDEELRVMAYMPEEPRDGSVYKLYVPCPNTFQLEPIYLCKAENNGTVYIFSDIPVAIKNRLF